MLLDAEGRRRAWGRRRYFATCLRQPAARWRLRLRCFLPWRCFGDATGALLPWRRPTGSGRVGRRAYTPFLPSTTPALAAQRPLLLPTPHRQDRASTRGHQRRPCHHNTPMSGALTLPRHMFPFLFLSAGICAMLPRHAISSRSDAKYRHFRGDIRRRQTFMVSQQKPSKAYTR